MDGNFLLEVCDVCTGVNRGMTLKQVEQEVRLEVDCLCLNE